MSCVLSFMDGNFESSGIKGPMRGGEMEGNGIKYYMEIMEEQGLSGWENGGKDTGGKTANDNQH